jgi:hypothetical protein
VFVDLGRRSGVRNEPCGRDQKPATHHGRVRAKDSEDGDWDAGEDASVVQEYRSALEEMVTFERAGSIGGALFQIVLAATELESMVGSPPDSVQAQVWREESRIIRLLKSAAAIIAQTEPAQLADVMPAVRVYSGPI